MKQPFCVRIEEKYVKEVTVYAEDAAEAEERVEGLCNCGDIEITYNDFYDRDCKASKIPENAVGFYGSVYGGDDDESGT